MGTVEKEKVQKPRVSVHQSDVGTVIVVASGTDELTLVDVLRAFGVKHARIQKPSPPEASAWYSREYVIAIGEGTCLHSICSAMAEKVSRLK